MSGAALQRADAAESVLIQGDLSRLGPDQRVEYYQRVCESLGLNPLTKPFEYLTLQGKTILYARRDCTEQLRKRDRVSVQIVARELTEGVYVVTARAATPDGRADESIGAVTIDGLKGEARANAMMKAETKAKRRVTLSICGLGVLDESEVAEAPEARPAEVKQLHEAAPAKPEPFGEGLNACRTLDELKAVFARVNDAKAHGLLSAEVLDELTAVKDRRKAELMQPAK